MQEEPSWFWEMERALLSYFGMTFTLFGVLFLWAAWFVHRAEAHEQSPQKTFWTRGICAWAAFLAITGAASAISIIDGNVPAASDSKPVPRAQVSTAEPDQPSASIEIMNVRVSHAPSAGGILRPMVYIDWKNVGNVPVTRVKADILALDAWGQALDYHARDYYIFVADGKPAIQPGQSYYEPGGQGHFLLPTTGVAASARVQITEVSDKPFAY